MKENNVQDRHRPGLLKQQNKIHKHGRHRSKGEINNANKGNYLCIYNYGFCDFAVNIFLF